MIILAPTLIINSVIFLYDLPELAARPYRDFLAEINNDIDNFVLSRQGQFLFLGYILLVPVMSVYRMPPVKLFVRTVYLCYKEAHIFIMVKTKTPIPKNP